MTTNSGNKTLSSSIFNRTKSAVNQTSSSAREKKSQVQKEIEYAEKFP